MEKTITIQTVAEEMYNNLERKTRKDESVFYACKESIEWQTDIIHKAHGEYMPNDFIYDTIHTVLSNISDLGVDSTEEEAQEVIYQLEPDCYTANLTAWLHDNNNNVYYLTEALETGVTDGFQALAIAQQIHIQEIAGLLVQGIIDYIEAKS